MFLRNWPPLPLMEEAAYRRYRLRLAYFIVAWVVFVTLSGIYWSSLPGFMRVVITILGMIFSPDFSMIEQLFISYKRYRKEG